MNLEIEGAQEKTKLAMVQDIQHDPLSGSVTHVDFHAVREDETVHAHIPIELTGSPAGVKLGGLLEHLIHSIEIHCRPADLPEKISHDVSGLEVGQGIHVRDLVFPDGVTSPMDGEVLVAIVAESRAAVSAGAGGSDESADAGEAPSA